MGESRCNSSTSTQKGKLGTKGGREEGGGAKGIKGNDVMKKEFLLVLLLLGTVEFG